MQSVLCSLKSFLLFGCILLFYACDEANKVSQSISMSNPASNTSCCSNLHLDQDNQLYLSWIEEQGDSTSILKISKLEDHGFSAAQTIAQGDDWFVNWADFPSVHSFKGTHRLLTHWLQKSAAGTYDYDIRFSIVSENQISTKAKILHQDSIATEHGFVAYASSQDQILAVWLDGRNMKKTDEQIHEKDDHGHGSGAMTLRSALIDSAGNISHRMQVDDMVCECCQTDLVTAYDGIYTVYRNRNDQEHRDIYYSKFDNDHWTEPAPVHLDRWMIHGCPVNGPAIDAQYDQMATSWFTRANDLAKVQVSFFDFENQSFLNPMIIASGADIMGRVDIEIVSQNRTLVSWMKKKKNGKAGIYITSINHKDDSFSTSEMAETTASRSSGFPIIKTVSGVLYLSYSHVDEIQKIKTIKIDLNF